MSLFQNVDFIGHSGNALTWKIECDALTADDWAWAATRVAERVSFYDVQAIPRGGLNFAHALEPYIEEYEGKHLLVVDDILTTGGSMREWRAGNEYKAYRPDDILGVVLFARIPSPEPWIKALFTMPEW